MHRHILIAVLFFKAMLALSQTDDVDLAQDLSKGRDKLAVLEKQENLSLLRYRPVYFLYGHPDAKAQLSFRFLLVRTVPLYAAYTQIIFWRLSDKSKPFEDATYNPEIFYRWFLENKYITSIDLAPWSHLSNGKDDVNSRSVDESFIRLNTRLDFPALTILLSGTVAGQYNPDDTNKDLYLYRGPFSLQGSLINFFDGDQFVDKGELTLRLTPGGRYGNHWRSGGYEVGFNFRFGTLDVFPTFYLQYYQGFAESMINYCEHVRQFRAGISF